MQGTPGKRFAHFSAPTGGPKTPNACLTKPHCVEFYPFSNLPQTGGDQSDALSAASDSNPSVHVPLRISPVA